MEAYYLIDGVKVALDDESVLQRELEKSYGAKKRPLCPCMDPGVEMYIAKIGNKYVVKRMPDSGGKHDPYCESYEFPAELSGRGQVVGSAIQEDVETHLTTLKFDFSLSKGASRAAPVASGIEKDSVTTDGKKLTLRGTLHYLWEQAGFHSWTPAMENKRNWYVIRKHLLEAAKNKEAKGAAFDSMLFIPETFRLEYKDDIAKRRIAALSQLTTETKSGQKLMLIIGEVKAIEPARYDYKMLIKHLPDMEIMLNADIHKRMNKRFQTELELWTANEKGHLIVVGTFGINKSGTASFNELALMMVNENWIPYEDINEFNLVDELTRKKQRFFKSLRYNLPSSTPLASVLHIGVNKVSTAMYVCPASATESYREALEKLIEGSEITSWVWDAGQDVMPALPGV